MRVVTWNLFHGRSKPNSGRNLAREFVAALLGWKWDVALLQEVPPWWPPHLARAAGAQERSRLTSRNWCLPLRRAIASRNPDLLKSSGGGANTILVRGIAIEEHRVVRLRHIPEQRWAHGVRLADGSWVVNLHAQNGPVRLAIADCERALATARGWAGNAPMVFGGDLNWRTPEFAGLIHLAGHDVDHLFTSGRPANGPGEVLDSGILSDHKPVTVTLA
jgi:endonuclease/exonuclease/phosphatase family metal-dependent hydrolase